MALVGDFSTLSNHELGILERELDVPIKIEGASTALDNVKKNPDQYSRELFTSLYEWLCKVGKTEQAYEIGMKWDESTLKLLSKKIKELPTGTKLIKGSLKILGEADIVKLAKEDDNLLGGHLSNIAKKYGLEDANIKITKSFDWKDGEYGDAGSCFWHSRKEAKDFMEKQPNFFGLLMNDSLGGGIGRCWLSLVENGIVLFNVYSKITGDLSLQAAGGYLVNYLGMPELLVQPIALSDNGSAGGILYINGGKGVLVGKNSHVGGFSRLDFNTKLGTHRECFMCHELVARDSTRQVQGHHYCMSCYQKTFFICSICGEIRFINKAQHIEDGICCMDCYDRHTILCKDCGKRFYTGATHRYKGKALCKTCLAKVAMSCPRCDDIYSLEDMKHHAGAGRRLCPSCFEWADRRYGQFIMPSMDYATVVTTSSTTSNSTYVAYNIPEIYGEDDDDND